MSTCTQNHAEWVERQAAQDRIDNQLLELITHDDKWGVTNESLNMDKRPKETETAIREKRRHPVRVM